MNKALSQSVIYFINVIFHLGVFWILFTVAVPESFTIKEQIIDFWNYPEGKEIILLNLVFILVNLIFAFAIIFYGNKSLIITITFTITAWVLVVAIYLFGANGLIFSYILGAISLTHFSIGKYNVAKNA